MKDEYDPLQYDNIARHIAGVLQSEPLRPLPPLDPFEGGGVYVLYYAGAFSHYRDIAKKKGHMGEATPIYVGKATPEQGKSALFNRLKQHARSIDQVENLDVKDFECRYLVLVPIWVRLTEELLIREYQPLWNGHLRGFGNHDPGVGRAAMERPDWDTVHPGRDWSVRLKTTKNADDVWRRVADARRQGTPDAVPDED